MLLLTGLVAAASFCPSPAVRPQPLAAVQSVHAPAVLAPRCVAPRASASGDEHGDHWTQADDMALQDYINLQLSSAEAKCGPADRILAGIEEVWVLIFNVGKRNEGVYTLQGRETPYVLGFERMTDADRFARALQVDFDFPTPIVWQAGQLAGFCQSGGFEVSMVPMVREPSFLAAPVSTTAPLFP